MRNRVFIIFLLIAFHVSGQKVLSLEQAIAEGLKTHFQVQLAKNDSLSDRAMSSAGSAGFLPVLMLNAGASKASNNIRQEFSNGLTVNRNGVGSDAFNSGLALNWTLFDGMRMFVTREKMAEIRSMGTLKVRMAMEQAVLEITESYYALVREMALKDALTKIMPLYEERVNIATTREEIGNGTRNDVLLARIDLIEQRTALMRQDVLIESALNRLKQVMGIPQEEARNIEAVEVPDMSAFESVLLKTEQKKPVNAGLELMQKQVNLSHYTLLEARAQRYPQLGLQVNYNFNNVQNQAGFALLNRNLGLNAGLNLSWAVFDGFSAKRNIAVAGFAENAARIALKQEQQMQEMSLRNARLQLKQALEIFKLEQEAVSLSKEHVNIMTEKFRLGQCTGIELREAQNTLISATQRSLSASYDAAIAAAAVRRYTGSGR